MLLTVQNLLFYCSTNLALQNLTWQIFSLILRIFNLTIFFLAFKHLCLQIQAYWHVQFSEFLQLKFSSFGILQIIFKSQRLQISAFIQTPCFRIPLLICSLLFIVNSKRLSHIVCKAATRIVQNMLRKSVCQQWLQISADHLVLKKE